MQPGWISVAVKEAMQEIAARVRRHTSFDGGLEPKDGDRSAAYAGDHATVELRRQVRMVRYASRVGLSPRR